MEFKISIALHVQIYILVITKIFGGRQILAGSYADFVYSSAIHEKIHRVARPRKLGRAHFRSSNKTSFSSRI